jgi:hypothetical protein
MSQDGIFCLITCGISEMYSSNKKKPGLFRPNYGLIYVEGLLMSLVSGVIVNACYSTLALTTCLVVL